MGESIDSAGFDRLDRSQRLIALDLSAVAEEDESLAARWCTRRSTVLAIGRGEIKGARLAAGLWSDLFFVADDARLKPVDGQWSASDVIGGVVSRLGRHALPLLFEAGEWVDASEAIRTGLVDGLVTSVDDPLAWARRWIGRRSVAAMISGASLLRHRGGDVTERSEFARLFAIGSPQRGLGRFLDKVPLDFSDDRFLESE